MCLTVESHCTAENAVELLNKMSIAGPEDMLIIRGTREEQRWLRCVEHHEQERELTFALQA